MKKSGFTNIILIIIGVLILGAIGYFSFTKTQPTVSTVSPDTKTQPAVPDTSLNWKNEFGNSDWQKSVSEVCDQDFAILKYGKSDNATECTAWVRNGKPLRHLTDQEKNFFNFITEVVKRVALPGYVLGGVSGDSRDVWVEDLNSDGQMDMVIFLTPESSKVHPGDYFPTDTSHNIFMIVTPTNVDGTSKKVAEISNTNLKKIAPDPWGGVQVENTIDFNHDGIKELVVPGYGNKPTSAIFKIDWQKGLISQLSERTSAGKIQPAYIIGAGGFGYVVNGFLKDVDRDGVNELVYHDRRYTNGTNSVLESVTLDVYKWNGSLFDYSKPLSDQLRTSFDPAKEIPI